MPFRPGPSHHKLPVSPSKYQLHLLARKIEDRQSLDGLKRVFSIGRCRPGSLLMVENMVENADNTEYKETPTGRPIGGSTTERSWSAGWLLLPKYETRLGFFRFRRYQY